MPEHFASGRRVDLPASTRRPASVIRTRAMPKGRAERARPTVKGRHSGGLPHHLPVFGMEAHGSFGGSGLPFCNSSIECLSGERTNAITPSRGGRLIVTPAFINFSHSP